MNTKRKSNRKIIIYISLIVLGITMPGWLGPELLRLESLVDQLRIHPNGDDLMITALLLVTLNTIRALPHYLGVLLLGEELGQRFNRPVLRIVVPVTVIPLVYLAIYLLYPPGYHFGGPALLLLASISVLHMLRGGRLRLVLKALVLVQLIFGLQWLDTIVFLPTEFFGGGYISSEIRGIANEMGHVGSLSLYSTVLCSVFIANAVILTVYLTVSEEKWRVNRDLEIARGEMTVSRSGLEALHLLHGLKTPLSLIEGLNSLIALKSKEAETREYSGKMSEAIQSVNQMISQILYVEKKNWVTVGELIDYMRANKLEDRPIEYVFEINVDRSAELFVNKIRMARALINLINNASDAVDGRGNGKVNIIARMDGDELCLGVRDNGKGISPKELKKIYNPGYSTKAHTGIGLTFVQAVAAGHRADLQVQSKLGEGTVFWLRFPKEVVRFERADY